MPLMRVKDKHGRRGWRWGERGRAYFGPQAGAKARAQAGEYTENAFCATGEGGGVDPSCGKDHSVGATVSYQGEEHTISGKGLASKRGPNKGRSPLVLRSASGGTQVVYADELQSAKVKDTPQPKPKEPTAEEIEARYVPVGSGKINVSKIQDKSVHVLDSLSPSARQEIVDYSLKGKPDHELVKVSLKDIKPSQQGEDRDNSSSRGSAETIASGNLNHILRADLAPIVLKADRSIADGNHRFTAAEINGQSHIYAVVPKVRTHNEQHVHNAKRSQRRAPNPLRADPTRTASIRRRFLAAIKQRFAGLKKAVRKLLVDEDVLGLKELNHNPLGAVSANAFCATGEGGGQDNSCGGNGGFVLKEVHEMWIAEGIAKVVEVKISDLVPRTGESFEGVAQEASRTIKEMREVWDRGEKHYMPEGYVGQDGKIHVADGRHRIVAQLQRGRSTIPMVVANAFSRAAERVGSDPSKIAKFLYKKENGRISLSADAVSHLLSQNHAQIGEASFTTNARREWQFHTSPEKLAAFQAWLARQARFHILGATQEAVDRNWWRQYTAEGYRRGQGRAFSDVHRRATGRPGAGEGHQAAQDQFLRSSFGRPVAVEKVQLLAARTYTDLVGVTEQMSTVMSRTLTDGLIEGKNPREIADDLEENIDGIGGRRAETIARTEIIRAHAEGQLDALEDMGVEEVGVMVEWSTAGDERVCPECAPMEGTVVSIDEARGQIPLHPNCRCAWIPAGVGE